MNKIVLEVRSVLSDLSPPVEKSNSLLPTHGGYRKLKTFQVATLIYNATLLFCDRHIPCQSRTNDQMVQEARSGRQNIAEGSVASGTSKKSELKLINVAKASLEELLLDYEDYLLHQTTFLLSRQLSHLEISFLEEGGFTERLYRQRSDFRRKR